MCYYNLAHPCQAADKSSPHMYTQAWREHMAHCSLVVIPEIIIEYSFNFIHSLIHFSIS